MQPALTYARRATSWTPEDWWLLEAKAWESAPDVRRAIAFFAPTSVWRDLAGNISSRRRVGGCLITIVNIAGFVAPGIAAIAMAGWFFQSDRPAPLVVAAVLCLLASISAGLDLLAGVRDPGTTDVHSARLLGALHLFPSSLTAIIALFAAGSSLAEAPWTIVPVIADVVIGALHFVVYRPPAHEGAARWQRNVERLRRSIAALPEAERARVEADLTAAFNDLGARGLVDEATLRRARGLSLGTLGMTLAPRNDLIGRSIGDRRTEKARRITRGGAHRVAQLATPRDEERPAASVERGRHRRGSFGADDMTTGPAARFAASRRTWEPIDWWRLEARAWQEAPEVRRVMAFFAPTSVVRELAAHPGRHPVITILLLVWNLVGVAAPVVGSALLLGWAFGRADVAAVGDAGVVFAAGAVVAGAGLITSGRDQGCVDAGSAHAVGWIHAPAAAIALVVSILAVIQDQAEGMWGIAPIAADLIVGVLYFVVFRRTPTDGSARWKATVNRLAAAITALDEGTRARILADVGDAIDELETAGRIPESVAADARQTPPGMLGARFAPRDA